MVFCGVEFAVIYSHLAKTGYKPSLWLFNQPVMLSLPLLTGLTILRRLKSGSDGPFTPEIHLYMSYSLAIMTLISYLTLWIGIADFLWPS